MNQITDAAIDIGAVLLPAISGAAETVGGLATSFGELEGPAAATVAVLGSVSGGVLLVGGSLLLLLPRIASTKIALDALSASAPRTAGALSALGKAAGTAALIGTVVVALDQLGSALFDLNPDLVKMQQGLLDLAKTGDASGILRQLKTDVDGVRKAVTLAANDMGGWEQAWRGFIQPQDMQDWEDAREVIEGIDQTFAAFVTTAGPDVAALGLSDFTTAMGMSAEQVEVMIPQLDGYTDALAENKLATDAVAAAAGETGDATGGLGLAVKGTAGSMDEGSDATTEWAGELDALDDEVSSLTTSFDYLLGRFLDVDSAQIASRESLRDLIEVIKEGQQENQSLAEYQDQVSSSLIGLIGDFSDEYEALVRAGDASGTTADRNDFLRSKLDEVAGTLPGLSDQISDYKAKLDTASVSAQLATSSTHSLAGSLAKLASPDPIVINVDTALADKAINDFFGRQNGRGIVARLSADASGIVARGDGPGGPMAPRGGNALSRVQSIIGAYPGLRITSTYRTPAANKAAGGSPTSYHLDRNNPAVDIGGPTYQLDRFNAALGGGWREKLWRVPGHADHVHVAHAGGMVEPSWPTLAGLRSDERPAVLQVGERVIPKGGAGSYSPTYIVQVEGEITDRTERKLRAMFASHDAELVAMTGAGVF
jgi:hypothetical protein